MQPAEYGGNWIQSLSPVAMVDFFIYLPQARPNSNPFDVISIAQNARELR